MKLIIQIPCYNEEESLPVTLAALPKSVQGFDKVEWLIIDDGSTDKTVEIAKQNGAHHIVRIKNNHGLAHAFMTGLSACLSRGANVIVNTDADNQYNADDIPKLVAPILTGEADIVIGARPIESIRHFSLVKKILQKLGSWVVRVASNTNVPDAPSGFRAFSRDAAMRMNVFNEYTYTLETIIQAGQKNMAVVSVPISVNEDMRPSRLVKSIPSYVRRSILTIIRIAVVYQPFRFFMITGFLLFVLGLLPAARFLYFYIQEGTAGHVQSLVLTSILLGIGFQTMLFAFVADLFAVNRKLLEEIQYKLRNQEETHPGE